MACGNVFWLCKVGLKTSRKLLLTLCLVSLIGLLITHKDSIIRGIYPDQSGAKRFDIRMLIGAGEILDVAGNDTLVVPAEEEGEEEEVENDTEPPKLNNSVQSKPLTTKAHKATTKQVNRTTKPKAAEPNRTTHKSKHVTRMSTSNFLGDEYSSDDTHAHSKCPNNTRDKLKASFSDKFIASVPVFQWTKHAKESEYARLRRYSGTYGWMNIPWDNVKETLELLNSTANGYMFDTWDHRSPCIRCAVVGNGGILNGSKMGKEIDDHDFVFRVNGAVTRGFEEDVGNKTSFFFFSINTLMNSLAAYRGSGFRNVPGTRETRFLLLPDHDRDYYIVAAALKQQLVTDGRDRGRDPTRYFGKNLTTEHFKILHPDFMRYVRNRFLYDPILKTTMREIYRPSTGASMLMAAIHACDQVDAYGYMTPNYQEFSDHYFDKTWKKVVFYINHSFRREMRLWQTLHKAGVINLFMRETPTKTPPLF